MAVCVHPSVRLEPVRDAIQSAPRGFTIVELITVIILLGILSTVAIARFVQPGAFVPGVVAHQLVAESRLAQQLAVSRADASVSLLVDRQGADWRFRINTDVDGVVRTELIDADSTTLLASSGAASGSIDAAVILLVTFFHSGDVASVMIGASVGDPSMGVDLFLSGDSDRSICIYPSGYSSDAACS